MFVESFELLEGLRRTVINLRIVRVRAEFQTEKSRRRYRLRYRDRSVGLSVSFPFQYCFNPLNTELNPICHLLALLGGATIVVVSRLRVKLNTRKVFISLCI
jgi:hypothetical protein